MAFQKCNGDFVQRLLIKWAYNKVYLSTSTPTIPSFQGDPTERLTPTVY